MGAIFVLLLEKWNIKPFLLVICISLLGACHPNSDVNDPVELLWNFSGDKTDNLIIFLPGLYDVAEVFEKEQFFKIAREAGIKADFLAASIHIDHLLEKKLLERTEKDILQSKVTKKYKNIWFMGLSLGGLNSLLIYQKYFKDICGVVVLAPYLADKGLVKEINKAGGLLKWQPEIGSEKKRVTEEVVQQHILLLWLKGKYLKNGLKQIYLGYGKQDIYVTASELLESILQNKNVTAINGKHNLKTAKKIWRQQLKTRKQTGMFKACK